MNHIRTLFVCLLQSNPKKLTSRTCYLQCQLCPEWFRRYFYNYNNKRFGNEYLRFSVDGTKYSTDSIFGHCPPVFISRFIWDTDMISIESRDKTKLFMFVRPNIKYNASSGKFSIIFTKVFSTDEGLSWH